MTQPDDTQRFDPLLPCPFCGGEPTYTFIPEKEFGTWDTHNISCSIINKHDIQVIELTKADAIKSWNTRVSIPRSAAEKLRDALLDILWTRQPLGECKNKNIVKMETIAREAITEFDREYGDGK